MPATSTGAILRGEAKGGTAVGIAANKIISKGGLAPDELILQLVAEWLDKIGDSFLFDGFPRTVAQAEQFELLLDKRQPALELAISLEISGETIRARMLRRLTCSKCGKVISIGRHVARRRVIRVQTAAASSKPGKMITPLAWSGECRSTGRKLSGDRLLQETRYIGTRRRRPWGWIGF